MTYTNFLVSSWILLFKTILFICVEANSSEVEHIVPFERYSDTCKSQIIACLHEKRSEIDQKEDGNDNTKHFIHNVIHIFTYYTIKQLHK